MTDILKIVITAAVLLSALMVSCNNTGQTTQQRLPGSNAENTTVDVPAENIPQPAGENAPAETALSPLLNAGDYDAAIAAAQSALAANPSDESLKEKLADAYISRGWYYKTKRLTTYTRDDLRQAVEIAPDYYIANYELGRFHTNQWQYQIGIYYQNKAIALKGDYAPAWNERAFSYYKRIMYDQALDDSNHAIELQSGEASFYYTRSLIYRALGDNSQAVKDLQTTLEYSKDSSLTLKAEKDLQALQSSTAK